MIQFLGLTILSTIISLLLFVPFIDFMYRMRIQRKKQETVDMFGVKVGYFDKFNDSKIGTPIAGGLLIVVIVTVLTLWAYGIFNVQVNPWVVAAIFICFLGFGALGFLDDLKKITDRKEAFFGLRFRHKFLLQWGIALIAAFIFHTQLGNNFIFVRGIGLIQLGFLAIPFVAFVIVAFANAVNITDGVDGLAAGIFLICMSAFLAITSNQLDKPLGIFIAILLGAVAAFLYFNVWKARIFMGDVGALALGAALAVVGLLTGKVLALAVIGGVYVIEVGSSALQLLSWKYRKKPLFPVSPFHLYLQNKGWEEPKVTMRLWLLGFFFAIVGLYVAFIK